VATKEKRLEAGTVGSKTPSRKPKEKSAKRENGKRTEEVTIGEKMEKIKKKERKKSGRRGKDVERLRVAVGKMMRLERRYKILKIQQRCPKPDETQLHKVGNRGNGDI